MKAFRDLLNSASADELLDLLRAHRRFTYDYEDFLMKFLCIDTVAQAIQNIARPSDSGESPVKTEVHVRQGATRDIDPHHALYKNAIAFLENLIATNPEDWEKRATALNILGVFIADRYTSTHDPSDLLLAIAVRQNAIERTPVDTQELSLAEYNLGLLHHRLYACTRTRAYLESAWAFTSRALELADLAPGDRATVELLKARLLIERYREEQQNEALVLARTTLESALERLPAESLGRINLLDTLAEAAAWQHNASANTEPLDCAIERIRQSASLSEPDSPELPDRLLFLSNMLYEKYSVTGSTQELEASLSAIISALELQATFLQPSYIKGIAQFSIDDLYAFDGSLAELQRQYGARIRHLICRPQTTRNDLAENFATCAARCTELYRLTSNLPAQETAVWALQCATHYCTEGAILHTKYLGQLAGALRLSFHASGKRKYLHASVEAIERAIKNLGTESDLLVDLAWDLGTIQNELYTLTNKQDHLDSSIIAFSTAVLHCPETRPDCYLLNFNFGTALLTRHQLRRSRRVQPLGGVFKAIARKTAQIAGIFATLCGGAASSGKSGAASTQKSHEDRPSTSDSPAGVSEDLVRCLPSLQFALEHAPSDDSRLPLIRTQLAAACFEEYQITMKPQYLLRSIEVLGSALETADPNSKERDIITGNLASSLHAARMLLDAHHSSCKTAPSIEKADFAVAIAEQIVQFLPDTHEQYDVFRVYLGHSLRDRSHATGNLDDIMRSAATFERILRSLTEQSGIWVLLPDLTADLSEALRCQYERDGAKGLRRDSIDVLSQSIARIAEPLRRGVSRTELFMLLVKLGSELALCFELTNVLEYLSLAVEAYRKTLVQCSPKGEQLAVSALMLAGSLAKLFTHTGDTNYLEEAEAWLNDVLKLQGLDEASLAAAEQELGLVLEDRFRAKGVRQDLEISISLAQSALRRTPAKSKEVAGRYSNVANGLNLRYQVDENPDDLNLAILYYKRALRRTCRGSPDLARRYNNLGIALHQRYVLLNQAADLDLSKKCWQKAVDATPEFSPERARHLLQVAIGLESGGGSSTDLEACRKAAEVLEKAISLHHPRSPERAMALANLARVKDKLCALSRDPRDVEVALKALREAAEGLQDSAVPAVLNVSARWLRLSFSLGCWIEAVDAFEYVRRCADVIVPLQVVREDAETVLEDLTGLAGLGAYSLAKLGRNSEAAVALENGLAQTLARALESRRRKLQELSGTEHNSLFLRYVQATERWRSFSQGVLDKRFRGGGHGLVLTFPGEDAAYTWEERYRRIRAELDGAIHAIRSVKGYEDFLLPKTFSRITEAVIAESAIVYLAVTPMGGVALIVHGKIQTDISELQDGHWRVSAVWLDGLTEAGLVNILTASEGLDAIRGYVGAYIGWRDAAQRLVSLIKDVQEVSGKVAPVWFVKQLEVAQATEESARSEWSDVLDATTRWLWDGAMGPILERLKTLGAREATFVPSGFLNLLPLHAAWTEDGTTCTGRKYALDVLTITYAPCASAVAAGREAASRVRTDGVLAVDNPDGSLRFSRQEVDAVLSYFPEGASKSLGGINATSEAVLREMRHYPVFHFSTHGWAGWGEPLESGLLMASLPHLTLRDLMELRLDSARLAVLSACETGIPGTGLPDEVVGLPTGLVQAGVAGVVASLWSVNDLSTAMLMERFYRLWQRERLSPGEALCKAQIWLRDTTNGEKAKYFEKDIPTSGDWRMPADVAADLYVEHMLKRDPRARDFEHSFHWAPFCLTGV